MRRAARIDRNQPEIVLALRSAGAIVEITSQLAGGFPDIVVGWRGSIHLMEIKDGEKPPSARRLTDDESKFFERWEGFPVHKIDSIAEAFAAIGVLV